MSGGTSLYHVDFVHFSLESGMVFEGTTGESWTYLSFQLQMNKNASKMRIQNGFQEIFLLTFSNLSNDGIISAFARCENGWGNWHFLVWNRGQDLENRAAQPPPRIPRSTPRLPGKLRPCRFIRVYEFTSPSDPEKSPRERFYKDAISENGFRLEYVWKESRFMLKVLGLKNIWLRVDGTN